MKRPLPKRVAKAGTKTGSGSVTKTFRLPKDLANALIADAKQQNITATDLLVSILTRYARFDRNAEKFGLITVSKNTYGKLFDGLSEEKIRELATSQSVLFEEFITFWFHKKNVASVLEAVGIMSKYQWAFDYTVLRRDHELTIALRTDLGKKFALFFGLALEKGIARTLGVVPRMEFAEHQVNLTIPISGDEEGF